MTDPTASVPDPASALGALLVFLGLTALVALSGALFRPGSWYDSLEKPGWRPPNKAFGPVWTLLYIMIAVSGWLVWRAAPWPETATALAIFGLQLALNAGWSAVFFGLKRPGWAVVEIAALWASILATMVAFAPFSLTAAGLLAPYFLWVSFAAALNVAIWRRNPTGRASDASQA